MAFRYPNSEGRRERSAAIAGIVVVVVAVVVVTAVSPNPATIVIPLHRDQTAATTDDREAAALSNGGLIPGDGRADAAPMTNAADAASDTAALEPSIQYEESLAHAGDHLDFGPGPRVTVGLTSRSVPSSTVDTPINDSPALGATLASAVVPRSPGTSLSPAPAAAVRAGALRREIFGFLPYWEVASSSLRLDFSKLSTIAYFGIGADAAGNLQRRNSDGSLATGWAGWTSSRMTTIIAAAHHAHTRVVLTVQSFGWTSTGLARQRSLLMSATARSNLARQIATAVRDRGADGVNLDFEPLAPGAEAGYVALIRSIRATLSRVHSGYQVTVDTLGSIGNYPVEGMTARGAADALLVMAYDYRTASSSPVGSVAPLNSAGTDIVDTVAAYLARIPASKVILGVGYYGRAWSTATATLHSRNTSSQRTGASTSVVYDIAAEYLARYGRRYDPGEQVAWTAYRRQNCSPRFGCVASWRQLYIDDASAIGKKYDLVNAYGLRGAGIWALGYDGRRLELWNVIKAKFINDTTAPIVGVRVLPISQANPAFAVSWTGVDDVAVKSYDGQVSVDGRPWTAWFSRSTATSAMWSGDDGHAYAFRVRGRDAKGNVSTWNVASTASTPASIRVGGFGTVLVAGLSVRAAADSSARRIGSLARGAVVAIVGGPRTADRYTWYQVAGPLGTWGGLRQTYGVRWVAVRGPAGALVGPRRAPNSTSVVAMIDSLRFGGGGPTSVGGGPGATATRSFSPNGDGSRDTMPISFTNRSRLTSLVLRIFRADGRLLGNVASNQLALGRRTAVWDGRVGRTRLPDGKYLVTLVGRSGASTWFNPVVAFRSSALGTYGITIDTVRPVVLAASSSASVMSPNGDGILDRATFSVSAAGSTTWAFGVAAVTRGRPGAPLLVRTGTGRHPVVSWDGRTGRGTTVADGLYQVNLVVSDGAGNRAGRRWTVGVDGSAPLVSLAVPASFSPNGDGNGDVARFRWTSSDAVSGNVGVYRGSTLLIAWRIRGARSGAIVWNGRTARGRPVPDGAYVVRVTVRDAGGNLSIRSATVLVDRGR